MCGDLELQRMSGRYFEHHLPDQRQRNDLASFKPFEIDEIWHRASLALVIEASTETSSAEGRTGGAKVGTQGLELPPHRPQLKRREWKGP